jgi:hypothetical protein
MRPNGSSGLNLPRTNQFLLSIYLLKLRSDQTDSVSVDLHQQRLSGDGRLLSFGHTCGRLRRRKIKSRHSRILRHRRQSANFRRSALRSIAVIDRRFSPTGSQPNIRSGWRVPQQLVKRPMQPHYAHPARTLYYLTGLRSWSLSLREWAEPLPLNHAFRLPPRRAT